MISETPKSIAAWADKTFGLMTSLDRGLQRMSEEYAELQNAHRAVPFSKENVAKEIADVCIVGMRIMTWLGFPDMINAKMEVNRNRVWKADGTGHGYHVKTGEKVEHKHLLATMNGQTYCIDPECGVTTRCLHQSTVIRNRIEICEICLTELATSIPNREGK